MSVLCFFSSSLGNDAFTTVVPLSCTVFQSTFPRGERQKGNRLYDLYTDISIHVPSWGTTLPSSRRSFTYLFQSTFPRGERQFHCLLYAVYSLFQSTFPRGERQYFYRISHRILKFQSTFPRGERRNRRVYCNPYKDFNPRSLVGNDY